MFTTILRSVVRSLTTKTGNPARRSCTTLRLERLEARDVPVSLTVTTDSDSHYANPPIGPGRNANGQVSLRSAVEYLNTQTGQNSITFSQDVLGKTIWLSLGSELNLDANNHDRRWCGSRTPARRNGASFPHLRGASDAKLRNDKS
jgi:hypothetical protein